MKFAKSLFLTTISISFIPLAFSQAYHYPQPTGQYAVGTSTHHWVDQGRSVDRELMAQIWYPAVTTERHTLSVPLTPEVVEMWIKSTWGWNQEFTQAIKDKLKKRLSQKKRTELKELLSFLNNYLDEMHHVFTRSNKNAPISIENGKFPVIIFSHGFACTRNYNAANCENLASHGYIVVSVDHTGSCWKTTFPDGRQSTLVEPKNILDVIKRKDEWTKDVQFTLLKIAQLNCTKNRFLDRFDMTKIGMFGHSMGGIVTTHMCKIDDRIKAGVTLDAPLPPKEDHGIEKPFMAMLAEKHTELCDKDYLTYVNTTRKAYEKKYNEFFAEIGRKSVAYKLVIQKTAHNTFCDQAILKEIVQRDIFKQAQPETEKEIETSTETLNGFYATEIINNYLVAFFNKFLKGNPLKPAPEVTISTWGTQP